MDEYEEVDLELEEDMYEFLLETSEDLGITPSELVSRILKNYIETFESATVFDMSEMEILVEKFNEMENKYNG